jgi:hypothetical protein
MVATARSAFSRFVRQRERAPRPEGPRAGDEQHGRQSRLLLLHETSGLPLLD